jgi:hypothetical protein
VDRNIQFVSHIGKQILVIDLSNCSAEDVEKIVRRVPDTVMKQPMGSVLLLADFTGASVNDETLRAMKETAVFDKPYIKKTAWVGAERIPEVQRDVGKFSRREFPMFKTRREAMDWLAQN